MAEEVEIGRVNDYFAHIGVAGIDLTAAMKVGDRIRIRGHTTDLEEVVESIQIEHEAVEEANAGDKIGVKVRDRVRGGDHVYRVVSGQWLGEFSPGRLEEASAVAPGVVSLDIELERARRAGIANGREQAFYCRAVFDIVVEHAEAVPGLPCDMVDRTEPSHLSLDIVFQAV